MGGAFWQSVAAQVNVADQTKAVQISAILRHRDVAASLQVFCFVQSTQVGIALVIERVYLLLDIPITQIRCVANFLNPSYH